MQHGEAHDSQENNDALNLDSHSPISSIDFVSAYRVLMQAYVRSMSRTEHIDGFNAQE